MSKFPCIFPNSFRSNFNASHCPGPRIVSFYEVKILIFTSKDIRCLVPLLFTNLLMTLPFSYCCILTSARNCDFLCPPQLNNAMQFTLAYNIKPYCLQTIVLPLLLLAPSPTIKPWPGLLLGISCPEHSSSSTTITT